MTDTDWIVAIHEAGHAVAAIRAGLVFDQVSVLPDESPEIDGALYWNESDAEIVMPPELLAVVLLAGPCAEAHVRGLRADRMFDGVAATQDREAMAVLGLSEQQFIAATKEALAIVERDWALIEKVAEGLADHERLDYEDVEFIVVAENQASN